MSNHANNLEPEDEEILSDIDSLFQQAEQTDEFWVSKAKYKFTEDMLSLMQKQGVKKGDLAEALGVKPAQITRLCSGENNFTIETMVRVARALKCELLTHLQPSGMDCMWIDVLLDEPARPLEAAAEYKTIATSFSEVAIATPNVLSAVA